jgi:hypothetical protein
MQAGASWCASWFCRCVCIPQGKIVDPVNFTGLTLPKARLQSVFMKDQIKMQIEDSKLTSIRGRVIGIGRVKIPRMKEEFDYEVPLLSFVVIEKKEGGYISSCIHLRIDGYGQNADDAQIDMIDNILYFLDENFNNPNYAGYCWANMLDLFEANESSSALWDNYHAFQIMLAERGCATDQYSPLQLLRELLEKIEALEREVQELGKKIATTEVPRDYKGSRFINTLKAAEKKLIVQYIHIPA